MKVVHMNHLCHSFFFGICEFLFHYKIMANDRSRKTICWFPKETNSVVQMNRSIQIRNFLISLAFNISFYRSVLLLLLSDLVSTLENI